jgi:hypothetical protein
VGNVLTGGATIGFSRRPLFHGVSYDINPNENTGAGLTVGEDFKIPQYLINTTD